MPTVLRIINRLNLGGPTFNACYLSRHLSSDYETVLVSGMKDESEASSAFIAEDMGLDPIYVENMHRSINPVHDYPALKKLRAIIRDVRPDIVHTHAAKAGALGRLAAILEGVPVLLHTFHGHVFHSYFNPVKTRVFLGIERALARRTTRIIAISELQRRELSETFRVAPAEKFSVIPLGFDLSRFQDDQPAKCRGFRAHWGLGEDDLAVGIIGRLVPVKNHELYLKALARVKRAGHDHVRGVVIGGGERMDELQALARDLGLTVATDRVHPDTDVLFTSWIRKVDHALAGLDVVCLTSHNEGTPVSLIEAQAAARPVVSTRVGGIEDVVADGRTGLLSDKGDEDGFVRHLETVVVDADLRKRLTTDSVEHVVHRFGHLRLARDMERLYDELLGRDGG